LYFTAKAALVPEFPLATVTLVGLVTAEVAAGFVVVQEKLMLQVLAPEAIVQEFAAGVSVPDITGLEIVRAV
jgi:hypothetical protein